MLHPTFAQPLVCPQLVGRDREVALLEVALQRAASGRPTLVLLSGDAGVGKTRLCRTFADRSREQGAIVLYGQALPHENTSTFGPFLDALHRYFATIPRTGVASGRKGSNYLLPKTLTALTYLLPLLPELAPLFPEIAPLEREIASLPPQQTLFHRILRGLLSLTRNTQISQKRPRPLLLILEDLHWADETSLELLLFLARHLDTAAPLPGESPAGWGELAPVLLVGTYRAEALPDSTTLFRTLGQLRDARQAREVVLVPLNAIEHRRCLNLILEQPVPEAFAAFLYTWDEGNPFLLEELLGALAAAGRLKRDQNEWVLEGEQRPPLPPSLTATIIQRLTSLPAADQEVLAYAAVIGREFDFPLLAAVSGRKDEELVGVLRRALRLQLLSASASDDTSRARARDGPPISRLRQEQERYQFRHALTRETIYEHLLLTERRLCHRAVAEAIETLSKDAGLLAEHYWLAGLPERARPYALHEADRASQMLAFREERIYLQMAEASLPEDSAERLTLLQRLGIISLAIFDLTAAYTWLSQAKSAYQRLGQPHRAALVMALLPHFYSGTEPMADLLVELEATTAEWKRSDLDTLVIYAQLALRWAYSGRSRRASTWIERALALFESISDPAKFGVIQSVFLARGWLLAQGTASDAEVGLAELRSVLQFAHQHGLPDLHTWGFGSWLAALMFLGRGDEAGQVLEDIADYAFRSGTPPQAFVNSWHSYYSGDWERGIELLRRNSDWTAQARTSGRLGEDVTVLAHFLCAQGKLAEAQLNLDTAQARVELIGEYYACCVLWWASAKLQTAQHHHNHAEASYERIYTRWKETEDTFIILPIMLDAITYYAEHKKLPQAHRWLAELQHLVDLTGNPVGRAGLLEAQGVLTATAGTIEEALALLRQAVQAWSLLKRPYYQARAGHRLAELLLTWARTATAKRPAARHAARAEAETLLEWVATTFTRLQIAPELDAVKALRARSGLEAQRKRRATLAKSHHARELTRRELEVVAHVAQGRTNREIAASLRLSPRTVERHMANILFKLRLATRSQTIAYALSRGWISVLPQS